MSSPSHTQDQAAVRQDKQDSVSTAEPTAAAPGAVESSGEAGLQVPEPEASSERGTDAGSAQDIIVSPFASNPSAVSFKHVRDGSSSSEEAPEEVRVMPQRMVSWQDDVTGRGLVTVREFEPSEAAQDSESPVWQDSDERKGCCILM